MPDPLAEAGADYLEQVLGAAMRAPAAAGNAASGRVVARLMVALVATGEDARLDPYLSFQPGRPSVCEVRSTGGVDEWPAPTTDLGAADALRAAAQLAASGEYIAEVFASDGVGRERCVFVTRGSMATYLFPDTGASLEPVEHFVQTRPPDATISNGQLSVLTKLVEALPTSADLVAALRELMAGMTVDVDATAIEDVIFDAVEHAARAGAAGSQGAQGQGPPAVVTPSAAASPLPEAMEELARAIVAHLTRDLRVPQAEEVANALAPLIPTASQIADMVVAQISGNGRRAPRHSARSARQGMLPTDGPNGQGAGGWGGSSLLYPEAQAAMERLEVWKASL